VLLRGIIVEKRESAKVMASNFPPVICKEMQEEKEEL
jgi:hypothetical protein